MKSLEAIQMALREQSNIVVAVVIIMLVMWLLRRHFARLPLWLLKRSLDEPKQYIIKVVEQSVYTFIDRALLTLIVYTFSIFFVQNAQLATVVNNIAVTIFLYTFFKLAHELIRSITASSHRFQNITNIDVDRSLMPLVRLLASSFIFIVALISIARAWDVDVTTVFAGLGIGGLAISFAAQDSIKNLIGFIIIVSDKPFVLNEYIVTPTAEGTIEDIGLRSVKVRCLDQSLVIVPNSTISNEPVKNWSRLEKRWFNFVVALPFATTARQIETFTSEVREMLQAREQVESDSVLTLFTEYDSSSLNILIRCYVTLPNWADAHAERMSVNLEINRIIDRLGLRLALPARYLTFEQVQDITPTSQQSPNNPVQDRATESGQSDAKAWVDDDDDEE